MSSKAELEEKYGPLPPGRDEKMKALREEIAVTDSKLEMLRKHGENPRKLETLEAVRRDQQEALEKLEEEERDMDELLALYKTVLVRRIRGLPEPQE